MRGERMLVRGRRRANSRMSEIVSVGIYEDGADPVTGDAIRVLVESHYFGPGRIKYDSGDVAVRVEASQAFGVQEPLLSIPLGSAVVEGDEVHVISSQADQSLTARVYRVEGSPEAGQTTSHRFPLKEL